MRNSINIRIAFVACVIAGIIVAGSISYADPMESYFEGEQYLVLQKWDKAIHHFTLSIKENPKFYLAYHNRAIAYSKKGEYDKCIADFKKAAELNPKYPDGYGLMGLVFEIKRDYKSALWAYNEALKRETRKNAKEELQHWINKLSKKTGKKK
jgi:tetratricopeptide (TPR) repeat protein